MLVNCFNWNKKEIKDRLAKQLINELRDEREGVLLRKMITILLWFQHGYLQLLDIVDIHDLRLFMFPFHDSWFNGLLPNLVVILVIKYVAWSCLNAAKNSLYFKTKHIYIYIDSFNHPFHSFTYCFLGFVAFFLFDWFISVRPPKTLSGAQYRRLALASGWFVKFLFV